MKSTQTPPWENTNPQTEAPTVEATVVNEVEETEVEAKEAEAAANILPTSNPTPVVKMDPPRVAKLADLAAMNPEVKAEDTVTVTVPKPFKLTVNHSSIVQYNAGIQEMPISHANHWYSAANGVMIYSKE